MTTGTPQTLNPNLYPDNDTLYGLLFQDSFEALMLTSPDGTILDVNPAACRLFGQTRDEIREAGREGLIDVSDPRVAGFVAERQRTGKAHSELKARHKDGTVFPVEFSSVVFRNPDGELRTCLIMRDISEHKTVEAERERLIHELRDALAHVKTLTGLLPICASCRKIRDEQGVWHPVEVYIRKHTAASFTHGICPDCRRTLYPENDTPPRT